MSLTEQVIALNGHVERVETRLDRFEARVEERFNLVDARFDQVDAKFAKVDERFDDMRRHFEVLTEAMRGDFRNLYDLVFAHMQETSARLNDQHADHQSLERRVTVLEARRKS